MIRITRLTDYGILLLIHFARSAEAGTRTARELSARTRVPLPTVSKILKLLAHHGILETHRGVRGGFSLAREARRITVVEIISALDGPIALTECSDPASHTCELEGCCPVSSNWKRINRAVTGALAGITLEEMAHPMAPVAVPVPLGPAARRALQSGGVR